MKNQIILKKNNTLDQINMRIAFFGTPPFAADVLSYLLENGVEVVGVISRPDKPHGRSSVPVPGPVRLVAEAHRLPHYQPEKVSSLEFIPTLESFQADMFIVVAYGEILSQKVLDLPKVACLNLHASLLPKYRGAAPIQRSIIEGQAKTGITVMHMVRKMDAGDMILKIELPIGKNTTYGELELEMRKEGSKALLDVIKNFKDRDSQREVQDESQVTFAPKLELEDCEISWELPSLTLHNLIRGVNPEPGAWCTFLSEGQKKRLKIYSTLVRSDVALKPREVLFEAGKRLLIGCGAGSLELVEVQLEGKKKMKAADFYRGLPKSHWEIL
jgi:methionyl-tRNA formyltransferase